MLCMVPRPIPPLVWCCLWTVPTAVLTPLSLPCGALLAVLGVACALATPFRWRLAGLASLPAFLAALPLPRSEPPPLPEGPAMVRGHVHNVTRSPETGSLQLLLGDERAHVRVTLDDALEILPGDQLQILARATPPAVPGLPPSLQAIAATARVTPGPWSCRRLAAAARRALERQLLERLPGEPGALLATLVLGRDTRPAHDVQAAHRATGLSHLLAVSGAHAAMLAFLLGLAGWHGRRRLLASRARTAVVLLLLAAYAAITGNEPPVLRAVVAYTLGAIAVHLGRPCGFAPLLLAPAVLTAFLQPDALLGPSFLLSYAAVAGLFLAGTRRAETRFARWVLAPLVASAWATLMTAPLTLWFFGQLAPWTVVLTPLLAPLVGGLLLGGLALALLGLVAPGAADGLALPLEVLANGYTAAVRLADRLPGTPMPAACAPPAFVMGLALLAAAILVLHRPDRWRCGGAALLLVLPHFVPLPLRETDGLRLFAVGHGQACLVTTAAGHHCAIDCGSMQLPFLAAERLAAALPRRTLDLLVVTHADQDHHNGIPFLLARTRVLRAIVPAALATHPLVEALRGHGAAITLLAPGERTTPAPHLVVSAPPLPAGASSNDQSLWASVTVGATRVLLTGDAEESGVAAAIAGGIAAPHDVLVLPHHGRANANARALLLCVQPRACLASAACGDGETALGPLVRHAGAELWVTGMHGSLALAGPGARIAGDQPGRPLAPRP